MTYGTALGGYISLFVRLTIWVIALAQIWAVFYEPKYVETKFLDKLTAPNDVVYNVTYDQGFPAFQIITKVDGETFDGTEGHKLLYNNETMFEFYFLNREDSSKEIDKIPTIAC